MNIIKYVPLLTPAIQQGANDYDIDWQLRAQRLKVIGALAFAALAALYTVVTSPSEALGTVISLVIGSISVGLILLALSGKIEEYDLAISDQALDKKAVDHYISAANPQRKAMEYIGSTKEAIEMLKARPNVNWDKVALGDEEGWFLADYLVEASAPANIIEDIKGRMTEEARQAFLQRVQEENPTTSVHEDLPD